MPDEMVLILWIQEPDNMRTILEYLPMIAADACEAAKEELIASWEKLRPTLDNFPEGEIQGACY